MSSIHDILGKWFSKNEAAVPRNKDEERLVTSRRAFLGLLGGTIAYAATSNPVARTLEILAEQAPTLQPFDKAEGVLQMLVPDKGWVSLGSLQTIQIPPPPEPKMLDFGTFGSPHLMRIPRMQPRSATFELRSVDDFGGIYNELVGWMDIVTSHRPSVADYKRSLRCQCLGVTWEAEGAFLSRLDMKMAMPDNTSEFLDTTFEIEIYSDSMRVITDTERDHAFA